MSDELSRPICSTSGHVVGGGNLEMAMCGTTASLVPVEMSVFVGTENVLLEIANEETKQIQRIVIHSVKAAVLGHAISAAAEYCK